MYEYEYVYEDEDEDEDKVQCKLCSQSRPSSGSLPKPLFSCIML